MKISTCSVRFLLIQHAASEFVFPRNIDGLLAGAHIAKSLQPNLLHVPRQC